MEYMDIKDHIYYNIQISTDTDSEEERRKNKV